LETKESYWTRSGAATAGELFNCVSHEENFALHLMHNSQWAQLADNEKPIVWHDIVLDQTWFKLEATFDACRQQEFAADIGDIHIQNVEMKEYLAALVGILRNRRATYVDKSATYVNFDNANLCGEGIIFLSKLVDVCSKLQFFCLCRNQIDNLDSARTIASMSSL
jgi:hypothetical protein